MEREAFIAVVKENQNLIYKICYSYCRDREDRKDLEQEILLQLWKSFGKFDGRVKISTWMYRIALNTAISFYRDNRKHNSNKVAVDPSLFFLPNSECNPEQDEMIGMLYQFIGALGEIDKALMLLYLEDTKYKDMADILGISESNVATKINRIKKALKEKFDTY